MQSIMLPAILLQEKLNKSLLQNYLTKLSRPTILTKTLNFKEGKKKQGFKSYMA